MNARVLALRRRYGQLLGSSRVLSYVQSRWYRAPEVLLGCAAGLGLDVWSVGLVIAEAALGLPLLPGESEYNQLRRIIGLLGPPPADLVDGAGKAHLFDIAPRCGHGEGGCGHGEGAYGDGGGAPQYVLRRDLAPDEPPLVQYLPEIGLPELLTLRQSAAHPAALDALAWLLQSSMMWDADARFTPADALEWIAQRGAEQGATHGGLMDDESNV